nr:chemotaxis response regulator protein-glutamate methylesterase [Pectinatus frisingensis]
MIRILIADDSIFMRKILSDIFATQADFTVVGVAVNGRDAIEKVLELKPDIMTLDVNMPIMDGLHALKVIMREAPLPVIMVSSLTKSGADETIAALEAGAVDFINKGNTNIINSRDISDSIINKCRAAVKVKGKLSAWHINSKRVSPFYSVTEGRPAYNSSAAGCTRLVAIGTSTGGPKALQDVITKLPADLPCGVVVVQHMPPGFTKSLADRLNQLSEVTVKEAENGDRIEPAHVYIAPGNYHMVVHKDAAGGIISLNQEPPIGNHRPSVNALFNSAVPFGKNLVAVIMTGMGNDGAAGMLQIKKAGGYVIAESELTSVVYGMPKAVVDLGIADEVLPVDEIANAIVSAIKRNQ